MSRNALLDAVVFDERGLAPVVVQDAQDGRVRMLAWADRAALERTLRTGLAHFRSRRRGAWLKGETSGHLQAVVEVRLDCDGDAVLYRVRQRGPACHEGTPSCFSRVAGREGLVPEAEGAPVAAAALDRVARTIEARRAGEGAAPSYVRTLLARPSKVRAKVIEEAYELCEAEALAGAHAAEGGRRAVVAEAADLLFHTFVLLAQAGVEPSAVYAELARREGVSGLVEKAARPVAARLPIAPGTARRRRAR